MSVTINH